MFVYRYGDEGECDFGWGCVYRNIQSALKNCGEEKVPKLKEMVKYFGLDGLAGKNLWIEPVDAEAFISEKYSRLPVKHAFLSGENGGDNFFRTIVQFAENDPVYMARVCEEFLKGDERRSIIVDDGTFSYILVGRDGNVLKGDPHKLYTRNLEKVDLSEFFGNKCWALCFVG